MSLIKRIVRGINLYTSMLVRRDGSLYVFGAWYGDKFADNSKYLYLYCIENGYDAFWVTKDKATYEEMLKEGLPVLWFDSKEEKSITRKAKYIFICCSHDDVNKDYIGGATIINLWHGIPLKKIMYDDKYNYNTGHESVYQRLSALVTKVPFSKEYVVSTSDTISEIYRSAFRMPADHVLQLGQPRNDAFFNGECKERRYSTASYKTLVTYMPTHRDMGRKELVLNRILNLEALDEYCERHGILFLIKKHYCHRNEHTDLTKYAHIVDYTDAPIDTQELLFNTDILITDYSSCYIDYLLLDRPVIFFEFDLETYLMNDREMYFNYDEVTPGIKVKNFDELLKAIRLIINNRNPYLEEQRNIKDFFYDPSNQHRVCEKILNRVNQL